MDTLGKANIPFRVTKRRREELKIVAARRRQSIQEMLEQGLTILLGEDGEDAIAPKENVSISVPRCNAKRVRRYAEALAKSMDSEERAMAQIIESIDGLLNVIEGVITANPAKKKAANGE